MLYSPESMPETPYATEANMLAVLHEARFAGGIAASGQRAGFGGNLFTRDSLRMQNDTMDRLPSMSRELFSILPQMQGVEYNDATNERPDAMPHQVFRQFSGGRKLPDAQMESTEYWTSKWGVELQYNDVDGKNFAIYNSSDGPLLYVDALARFCDLHGTDVLKDTFLHRPTGEKRTVAEAAQRAMNDVMESLRRAEEKGVGLYVVPNTNPKQTSPSGVMRDGFDSYYYPEGDIGKPVDFGFLAYIDNQGLFCDAMAAAAKLFPDDPNVKEWLTKADQVSRLSFEMGWMEDAGIFAAAIDEHGKQVALESNAAAETLNNHNFLQRLPNNVDIVRAIMRWIYSDGVMTPIGPRMMHKKFAKYEGEYYAYQGSGAGWPHANGIIAKGARNNWGLYRPSYDIGVRRTLGHINRAGEAVEVGFVERETNEPLYNPYESQARQVGARAIFAAEFGQLDQGWVASAVVREIWDWARGIPEEAPGTWQRELSRELMDRARAIPAACENRPPAPLYIDKEKGTEYKELRAKGIGLAA